MTFNVKIPSRQTLRYHLLEICSTTLTFLVPLRHFTSMILNQPHPPRFQRCLPETPPNCPVPNPVVLLPMHPVYIIAKSLLDWQVCPHRMHLPWFPQYFHPMYHLYHPVIILPSTTQLDHLTTQRCITAPLHPLSRVYRCNPLSIQRRCHH